MYIYSHVVFYAIGIKFAISFYPVLFPVCAVLPTHSRPQLSQDSRSVSAARLLLFPRSSRLCPRLLGRDLFPALPAAPGRAPPLFQIVSPAPPVPDRTLTPVFEAAVSPVSVAALHFPARALCPGGASRGRVCVCGSPCAPARLPLRRLILSRCVCAAAVAVTFRYFVCSLLESRFRCRLLVPDFAESRLALASPPFPRQARPAPPAIALGHHILE